MNNMINKTHEFNLKIRIHDIPTTYRFHDVLFLRSTGEVKTEWFFSFF